ncbi:MAG TPA: ATP-binding protein [Rubrobacteraceae bacterium]|nr:ATP-binding protein [Rubrobacteraceae bacterium]
MRSTKLWRDQLQVSDVVGTRGTRGSRTALAAALACWVAGALLFAAFPEGSGARSITALGVSWAAMIFAGLALAAALSRAGRSERLFWMLMGGGVALRFAGDLLWTMSRFLDVDTNAALAPQDVAYAISYSLFFGALLRLVSLTTRRVTLVSALDAASIMLSVGTLAWYFVLGPGAAEAGLDNLRDALVALFQPVCDAALLYLGLVVMSNSRRPSFVGPLIGGFLAFLIADTMYLGLRSDGPYDLGSWPDLFWALGIVLVGVAAAATLSAPAPLAPQHRIAPWRVLTFWLGPLSPPLQFGVMLLWGAFNPPLPAYIPAGAAVLLLYLAVRIGLISFVSRSLSEEQEALARELEQSRILYELHDTVKQSIHGVSLTLTSALEAERRGDHDAAREMFGRALETSREAEFQISRPYDELQSLRRETPPRAGDFLCQRLRKFEEYFGVKTHDDLQAPLEVLSPAQIAALTRVFVEALWNVAKHSKAQNLYLESRRVGSLLMVRIRDDGRGFDTEDPSPGLGLEYMRRRAGEVGARLDVISTPGRGTTVQIRFDRT